MGDQKSKEFETSFLKAGLSLDRRDFLKLIGGGIIVFFTCDATDLFGQEAGAKLPDRFQRLSADR